MTGSHANLQLPLFAFGTLRRGECHHHYLAGHYERVLAARLPDFARVAELSIARRLGASVHGELFYLKPPTYEITLRNCDRLEELPPRELIGLEYRRLPVRVQTTAGDVIAWAYTRPDVECDSDLQSLLAAEQERLRAASDG
jgi:gamma-glutamylcyclotransferase (GGCT)/AIG2-like uncharacterized protein YtfP